MAGHVAYRLGRREQRFRGVEREIRKLQNVIRLTMTGRDYNRIQRLAITNTFSRARRQIKSRTAERTGLLRKAVKIYTSREQGEITTGYLGYVPKYLYYTGQGHEYDRSRVSAQQIYAYELGLQNKDYEARSILRKYFDGYGKRFLLSNYQRNLAEQYDKIFYQITTKTGKRLTR